MFNSMKWITAVFPLFLTFACSTSDEGAFMAPAAEVALIPKQDDGPQSKAYAAAATAEQGVEVVISLEAKNQDINKNGESVCNPDEKSNGHRCSLVQNNNLLIADDQKITARGASRCFARTALEAKLFNEKIIKNGAVIECHPDAAELSECPAQMESCDASPQEATRCFAKESETGELAWTNRPEAWGKSECEARNNLRLRACDKGISPSEMKTIACEKEVSPALCPAIQQNCLVQGNDLVECRIRKIGDIPLKEALKGIGSTSCEASYRVKDLACRWQRKPINEWNEVECRSISKGETFPLTTAKGKIYKKIQRL